MRIKVNDTVKVLSGKDRGKTGKVVSVNLSDNKVTVEGVNIQRRAVRPSQRNLRGGFLTKNMPVPVAKVQLICPECQKATRVGYVVDSQKDENGKIVSRKKNRVCKKCGAVLPEAPYDKKRS